MAKVLKRSLYQTDYYAWTRQQAAALRAMAAAAVAPRWIWRTSPRRSKLGTQRSGEPCGARCERDRSSICSSSRSHRRENRACSGSNSVDWRATS